MQSVEEGLCLFSGKAFPSSLLLSYLTNHTIVGDFGLFMFFATGYGWEYKAINHMKYL